MSIKSGFLQNGQIGDGGEAPSCQPPKPSILPPSLARSVSIDKSQDSRVEIRCGNMRISTSSSSVPETEEELVRLLKEIIAILEAPDVEDKEFF